MKQVDGEPNELETLSSGKVVAKKNGYVYVFTSNESQQDSLSRGEAHGMLFDNFGVLDITGPVLEEIHYYPFGMTMAEISSTALLKIANNYKFNGKELNHSEFNDRTGLESYDFSMRTFDPQVARWQGQDLLADKYRSYSPYNYALNNPVNKVDPNGMDVVDDGDRWTITGNDIYTYLGYLQTINSGRGSWDNLEQGLEFASKKKWKGRST